MAEKHTKTDRIERPADQLDKRFERHSKEIETNQSVLGPKTDKSFLILLEQQIQQRAYELYEQRGWANGHDLEDWLQSEPEIRAAGERDGGIPPRP